LNEKNEYEIAYSLKPKYWGKGYATEIAKTMIEYGFSSKLSERFISIIALENLNSSKVAIKNGMKLEYNTDYLNMMVNVFSVTNKESTKFQMK